MKLFSPMFMSIALRNIRRNPRRSFLTISAIAIGLFCLIVFQGLKEGLHREMIASTINLDAGSLQIHARGYHANSSALRPLAEVEKINTLLLNSGVTSFSHRLKSPVLVLSGQSSSSLLLSGIDTRREPAITLIKTRIIEGIYPASPTDILVSRETAQSFALGLGNSITLMGQNAFGRPSAKKFTICGIYRTELSSFDRSHLYATLAGAQSFLAAEGVVTEIVVKTDLGQERETAESIGTRLPPNSYRVDTWQQLAPDVTQLIELNDATMQLLILIVFGIVALGITNTMSMAIFERFRELGVLSAIGTPPTHIITMITLESCFLGLFATTIGSIAGIAASSYLSRYGVDLTSLTSNNQYFATSHVLKAHLTLKDLVAANVTTIITAVIAGLYPAWKASKLEPVVAMRHT